MRKTKVSEVYEPICVKRILVSLDNSTHSIAALIAAVELARHFHAELKGVFVEDISLLNLAEMPFRQEVGEYTAIVREISRDGISRGIIVQSRWVIRTFRRIINATDIPADFVVLRGIVSELINKESQLCDLIIIGKSGTNPVGGRRLGSTARALIKNHTKPLLLVEEHNRIGDPTIVLYNNSPQGRSCLETARELLSGDEALVVLVIEDDQEKSTRHKAEIYHWAAAHKVKITIQTVKEKTLMRFIQMLRGLKSGLIILPYVDEPITQRIMQLCLEEVSLPILMI
jgi:nucleotide-binding universal stress UspA family protein